MKRTSLFLLLTIGLFSLSTVFTGCGPDDSPTPGTGGNDSIGNSITEFLIIDGTRYESKDFVRKYTESNGGNKSLVIWLNANYPYIRIKHEEDSSGNLLPRAYEISDSYSTGEFGYEVRITSADGPPPNSCSFASEYQPSTPHGTYMLKEVDGKLVSEFGKAQMECVEGGNGTDKRVIEGKVVWEEKN